MVGVRFWPKADVNVGSPPHVDPVSGNQWVDKAGHYARRNARSLPSPYQIMSAFDPKRTFPRYNRYTVSQSLSADSQLKKID